MILVIDCGSSKTKYIEQIVDDFIDFKPCRLMDFEEEVLQDVKGVIISGAPLLITEVNMEPYLEKMKWVTSTSLPVLGICFGHQLMGILHGAFGSKKVLCFTIRAELSVSMYCFPETKNNPIIRIGIKTHLTYFLLVLKSIAELKFTGLISAIF